MDAKNKLNSSLGLGETKKNKQLLYASGAQQSVLTFLGQSAKNQTSRSERPPKQKRIYHITTWKADIYIYIPSCLHISTYLHILHLFVGNRTTRGHPTLQHPSDSSRCLVGKNLRTATPEGQCSSGIFTNLTSWTRQRPHLKDDKTNPANVNLCQCWWLIFGMLHRSRKVQPV